MVAQCLAMIDTLDERIGELSREIEERQRPFAEAVERLDAIPGVGRRTAETLLAELGPDLKRFPTAGHLASWAGMCPGQNESAGKRHSGRTRKGNSHLRTALVEAGQAAGRVRGSYLGAQYGRLAARRGKKKATVAVAHSILVIAYHLLTRGTTYQDLGPHYLTQRLTPEAQAQRLIRKLERLGYKATPVANVA